MRYWLWTITRLILLGALATCASPAYTAWNSADPDAWSTAFELMQTRGYYLSIFLVALAALSFICALIYALYSGSRNGTLPFWPGMNR